MSRKRTATVLDEQSAAASATIEAATHPTPIPAADQVAPAAPSQHSLLPRSPVVLLLCQVLAPPMLLQWLLLLVELLRLLRVATVFCFLQQ